MSMTAVEKVLARTAGRPSVVPRDVVYPNPDFIMIHDGLVRGAKREPDVLGHQPPSLARQGCHGD
jgi:3-isopropylmalate/(R)-2-methylmalate dehydratase large subunit